MMLGDVDAPILIHICKEHEPKRKYSIPLSSIVRNHVYTETPKLLRENSRVF